MERSILNGWFGGTPIWGKPPYVWIDGLIGWSMPEHANLLNPGLSDGSDTAEDEDHKIAGRPGKDRRWRKEARKVESPWRYYVALRPSQVLAELRRWQPIDSRKIDQAQLSWCHSKDRRSALQQHWYTLKRRRYKIRLLRSSFSIPSSNPTIAKVRTNPQNTNSKHIINDKIINSGSKKK